MFILFVGALGLVPVLLSVSATRSAAPHRSRRLRVMQSNIAMLAVLAVVGVYLGVSQLVAPHGDQPLFLAVAAAGVVIAPTSLVTYVQLERQIPRGD
ncbi:hypothetical protein [Amnibacterium kyonggiense]